MKVVSISKNGSTRAGELWHIKAEFEARMIEAGMMNTLRKNLEKDAYDWLWGALLDWGHTPKNTAIIQAVIPRRARQINCAWRCITGKY